VKRNPLTSVFYRFDILKFGKPSRRCYINAGNL
jgi:hypothetical protein